MKKKVHQVFFMFQKILLNISFLIFNFLNKKKIKKKYIIGVDEIASVLKNLNKALEDSLTVNFNSNRFYDYKYDININPFKSHYINYLYRGIIGPILLGYLVSRGQIFVYIWSTGFLINHLDGREYEFSFLKSKQKKIINIFIGNDIRSPKKIQEYCATHKIQMTASFYFITNPERLTNEYEHQKKILANASDMYADLILSAPVDQASYLKSRQFFPLYFFPNNKYFSNVNKYKSIKKIKIIHAPTSPVIKGTELVRSAIKQLENEGYIFEYTEFINQKNYLILEALKNSHIAINDLYGQTPGVFGVEAMSNYCALITAADENIETSLPKGSNDAWLVTNNFQIYDHLRKLLINVALIESYARKGFDWSKKYASESSSTKKLKDLIQGII